MRPRVAHLALAAMLAAASSSACGLQPPDTSGRRETISLRMRGGPPDAAVVIDEETVGQLDFVTAHGVALPLGVHRVTVKAAGYFPWDREVEAKSGSPPIQLDVALTHIPD
jgi:hypothetical protein